VFRQLDPRGLGSVAMHIDDDDRYAGHELRIHQRHGRDLSQVMIMNTFLEVGEDDDQDPEPELHDPLGTSTTTIMSAGWVSCFVY